MSDGPQPQLHPLVAGFTDAHAYDRGRPPYDERAVALLRDGLGLSSGAPVLELGAGTGQLSRALLAAGLDVTAVEPLAHMRALLSRTVGGDRVLEGVAEDIPVRDGAVDAVLAADSFHWFDETRAMPEIRRVLRPGGGVAILRSISTLDAAWSEELWRIVHAERPDHPAFAERGAAAALEDDPAFGDVVEASLSTEWVIDRDGILAFLSSISWVGALAEGPRTQLLRLAADVLDRNEVRESRAPVTHQIWMARLDD